MSVLKKLIAVCCFILLSSLVFADENCGNPAAVTITSDGSNTQQDFIDAIACANADSTVTVGAGTWTISSIVNVNKALVFQGAGAGSTTLTVNVNKGLTLSASGFVRFTGFTVNGNVGGGYNGAFYVSNGSKRLDNIAFDVDDSRHAIYVDSSNLTDILIDHNTFSTSTRGINVDQGKSFWSTPALYSPGSRDAVYIEYNTFNSSAAVEVIDLNNGGGYVARFNYVNNANFAMHGADSGDRSGGWAEIYGNTFDFNGGCNDIFMVFRGGIQILAENDLVDPASWCDGAGKNRIKLQNWRSCYTENDSQPFYVTNRNDCQNPSENSYDQELDWSGWTCKDQIGIGPNQVRYGSYEWNNTFQGSDTDFGVDNLGGCSNPSTNDHIQSNRDYFNDVARVTSAPSGSCGTNYQGAWHDVDNDTVFDTDGTESFYKCVSGTWALHWTPLGVHPLAGGVPEITATLTGTVTGSVDESDIVTGGKTMIITLSGASWDPDIGSDSTETDALIAGIVGNLSEPHSWNNEMALTYQHVTRTSDTVVTITLPATAGYDITQTETVSITIDESCTSAGVELPASPAVIIVSVIDEGGEELAGKNWIKGATRAGHKKEISSMNDYVEKWCNERHKKIGEDFDAVWKRINTIDNRMWAIIVLLVLNLGGVVASIVLK